MDFFRHDCILREILEERKSLAGFLDAVFGFMSRNTDFYHVQKTKDDKIGFPKGVKEQILLSCMEKYEPALEEPKFGTDLVFDNPPPAFEEIEIVADEETVERVYNTSEESLPTNNNGNDVKMKFESQDIKEKENVAKLNECEYKNGSLCENYCWSQTLKDIELTILLPKEVKLGKHIRLNLKSNHINIKALLPKEEILISGDTWDKYRYNDVVWTITDGKLVLSLDKLKECWWDKLLVNEKSINIKELEAERFIDEYPEDTQNVIEKLHRSHLQEQEFKTLPLSESEQMERMRQAWHAEVSASKEQPFHFSKFN